MTGRDRPVWPRFTPQRVPPTAAVGPAQAERISLTRAERDDIDAAGSRERPFAACGKGTAPIAAGLRRSAPGRGRPRCALCNTHPDGAITDQDGLVGCPWQVPAPQACALTRGWWPTDTARRGLPDALLFFASRPRGVALGGNVHRFRRPLCSVNTERREARNCLPRGWGAWRPKARPADRVSVSSSAIADRTPTRAALALYKTLCADQRVEEVFMDIDSIRVGVLPRRDRQRASRV